MIIVLVIFPGKNKYFGLNILNKISQNQILTQGKIFQEKISTIDYYHNNNAKYII